LLKEFLDLLPCLRRLLLLCLGDGEKLLLLMLENSTEFIGNAAPRTSTGRRATRAEKMHAKAHQR
jgi:hypothetical protein